MIAALRHEIDHGPAHARELAAKEWVELDADMRRLGVPGSVIAAHRVTWETAIAIGYMHGVATVLTLTEAYARDHDANGA